MMGDDPALPTISILGVPFHSVTMDEAVRQIGRLMEEERVHQVVTVNPEFVMTAQEDAETMDLLQRAELSLADGVGILYAARWRGSPLPERVAGSDLIFRLAAEAAREGWRIFLLGAAPGVAEETAAIL
ncbi:MAG: WecB/TagA/CpsF family glycosyltransferase, partial [Candidatus Promineifilaceae bacterium]|nr:WecB/TagA/CpsF family glycosyltransferase [Candidatus Promineifilaceae bacterium]